MAERSRLSRFLLNPAAGSEHLLRAAADELLRLLPFLAGGALAIVFAAVAAGLLRERRGGGGAQLLEIGVPPAGDEQGALLLWSALHDLIRPRLPRLLFGQPQIAFELAREEGRTSFRLWLPHSVPAPLVERAVEAAWPGASCMRVGESVPIEKAPRLAACELGLSGPDHFTLERTHGGGSLRLLLSQLAGFEPGERALVQIVASPLTARAQVRLRATARRLHLGIPPARIARLVDLIPLGPSAPRRTTDPGLAPDVREVLVKASRPLFRVNVRLAVAGPDCARRRGQIHALCSCFAGFEGRVGLRRRRPFAARRALALRRLGRNSFSASIDDLAALATLPVDTALPGLTRAGARALPPPPNLPLIGKPLGKADAGPTRPLALAVADARQHIHIVGATGVGKTTEIVQLVLADARARRGAVVIDPKGDLVDDILARLKNPPDPLVVFDPERNLRPVGLNVLQGQHRDLVAEHVVGTFRRIYEQFWGPRTDDILRACVLTLARDPRMTLAEIPTCLADAHWRRRLTEPLAREDPVLAGFWRSYDGLSDANRAQVVGPLLNKLRAFLLRRPVRAIVGQEQTSFDLDAVLDGGLLLARLPKGSLGEETSRLLGALLVARVWQQVLARSRTPEQERPDCALYVDEVHNYLALPRSFEDLLAEARGYRLSLCLAHQHLGQLPKQMAEALSANARTKLVFTCSPEDARTLERHFAPELTAHDLANLGRHQAACRTLANGEEVRPFTLRTLPLPEGDASQAVKLRERSERAFGRDLSQVEQRMRLRQLAPTVSLPDPTRNPSRNRSRDPQRNRSRSHDRAGTGLGISMQSDTFTQRGEIPDKGGERT
jgi:hypothetical protein